MAKTSDQNGLQLVQDDPNTANDAKPEADAQQSAATQRAVAPLEMNILTQAEEDDRDFWNPGNEDVIMPEQRSVAVYCNKRRQVVIRQEGDWNDEGDSFVFVHPQHIDALVDRLMIYKAEAERMWRGEE